MEFCPESLFEKLNNNHKPFSEKQALQYLKQIAKGLSVMHKKGLMHRDLKPENILISDSNICKIGDFGLVTPKPTEKGFAGTPIYSAPEVLLWYTNKERAVPYTKKCDIYSLGLILGFMMVGTQPEFNSGPFYKIDHLSKNVKILYSNLVNNDPNSRPTAE